jgi:hypothetical protein
MAKVTCPNPNCRTVSTVPEQYLGRKVACKQCHTQFVAVAANAGPTVMNASRTDTGTAIRVVARRSAARPTTGSGMLWGAAWLMVGVIGLVIPIVAAGTFVFFHWVGKRGQDAAEVYGGIEIGSSGVKATVIEVFAHPELGYDYRVKFKKSLDTKVVTGLDRTGQLDPNAVADTVHGVQSFFDQLTQEHHVPRDRVFIVASSGLFKAIRDRPDLVRKNQAALAGPIESATGRTVDFIDVRQEVPLTITGLIPQRYTGESIMIDAGTGATRGGYKDTGSGQFVTFEAPGAKAFESKVKSRITVPEQFAATAAGMAEKELRQPLRQAMERKDGLVNRPRVYLNGGTVWVMATLLHPAERGQYVQLTAGDIDAFQALLRQNPRSFPPLRLPDGIDASVRKEVETEVADMRDKFTPQRLMAGAEVLKAISVEFQLQRKEVFFPRDGDVAWLLSYIGQSYLRDKGSARK